MRIGVLALQGGFAAHVAALGRAAAGLGLDARVELVRRPAALDGLSGVVLPGGESTTLLKLLAAEGLDGALRDRIAGGLAALGTCAGAILLAREVENPVQASLGLLDARVERNSYGRQVDSFATVLAGEGPLAGESLEAVFIRAPRFRVLGPGVDVLARCEADPVLVRQGRILAATFHPELTGDVRIHALFLGTAASA